MGRRLPMRPKLLLKLKQLRQLKLSVLLPSRLLPIKLPPSRPLLSRLLLRWRQIAR